MTERRPAPLLLALALAATAGASPPLSMTDPDGQALPLERLDVRIAAHGPLALTELELRFRNPEPHTVEGRFSCRLPTEASLSRFARELNGSWLEGEVVEKKKARKVYSAAIARSGGASLLQRTAGNRFSAKVFPVAGNSTVRLILSYTSVLPLDLEGQRSLRVPLTGLPEVGALSLRAVCRNLPGERVVLDGWLGTPRVERQGDQVIFEQTLEQEGLEPVTDLMLRFRPDAWSAEGVRLRAGDYQVTTLRPGPAVTAEEREPDEWVVLVDTSASQALDPDARVAAIRAVIAEVERGGARRTSVEVLAFDLEVTPLLRFRAGFGDLDELDRRLRERGFLGATDLGATLAFVAERANRDERTRSFLLITDAVATHGDLETPGLLARLGELPASSRMHLLSLGGDRDADRARALAAAGRGRLEAVATSAEAERDASRAVAALRRVEGEDFEVRDPGAEWVHPAKVRDVAPGQELVIFSRLKAGERSQLQLVGNRGTTRTPQAPPLSVPGFSALLEKEVTRARLRWLKDQESSAASYEQVERLRAEQVDLSTRNRVVCSYTSLLVLNFEEDYERHGIDRSNLPPVLTVGPEGALAVARPTESLRTFTPQQWAAARADQRQRNFPAGRDPLIKVRAPAGTRRIVALFPWGETKLLRRDRRDGQWKARFVIPRWLAHGSYRVVLFLTLEDGRRQRTVVRFGADRRRPEGEGATRAWRTGDGWRVHLEVEASADTLRAEAQLPGGVLRRLEPVDGAGHFELVFDLLQAPGPTLSVPVTLFDGAHNQITVDVEVELR